MSTITQYQDERAVELILSTVLSGGAPDPDAATFMRAMLPSLFEALPDVAGPTIRRLRVQKAALDALIGYYQRQVDRSTDDFKEALHQQIATLQVLRTNTQADLLMEQRQATGTSGVSSAVGMLATPPSGNPNPGGYQATDPRFRGSAYYHRLPRRP